MLLGCYVSHGRTDRYDRSTPLSLSLSLSERTVLPACVEKILCLFEGICKYVNVLISPCCALEPSGEGAWVSGGGHYSYRTAKSYFRETTAVAKILLMLRIVVLGGATRSGNAEAPVPDVRACRRDRELVRGHERTNAARPDS